MLFRSSEAPKRKTNTAPPHRLPTSPSTSMSTPRTCSRPPSSSSTARCSSPIPDVASPRSSVERVPAPDSRSLTVKRFLLHDGGWGEVLLRGGWITKGDGVRHILHWSDIAHKTSRYLRLLLSPDDGLWAGLLGCFLFYYKNYE